MKKYLSLLLKVAFIAYVLIAINNVSHDVLMFTISSPLLFAIAELIVIFTKNNKARDRILLIFITLLYAGITIMGLLISKCIIYVNFLVIAFEIIITKLLNLNEGKSVIRAMVLSVPLQIVFVTISFSIYHSFLNAGVYVVFVVIMSVASVLISIPVTNLVKMENPRFAERSVTKKTVFYIFLWLWIIPFMYSYVFYEDGFMMKIDLMIYGLLLALYPYAVMLIAIHPKTKDIEARK